MDNSGSFIIDMDAFVMRLETERRLASFAAWTAAAAVAVAVANPSE